LRNKTPFFTKEITIMTKLITAAIATLVLASCEGLTVGIDNEKFQGGYSAKGGLVVSPKIPTAITIIEPAK
jgi:hypothetical protein